MSNGGEEGSSMVILGEVVCLVQDEKIMSSILDSTCWCGCTDAFIDAKVFKTMNVFKTMQYIVMEVSSFTIIPRPRTSARFFALRYLHSNEVSSIKRYPHNLHSET